MQTDPMGDDDDLPLFDGPADLASRTDELLAEGFGALTSASPSPAPTPVWERKVERGGRSVAP